MLYTYRKVILISFVVLLVLVGGGIGVYMYRTTQTVTPNEVQKDIPKKTVEGIEASPIPPATKDAIIRYATGTATAIYGEGSYEIVLRTESYSRTVAPDGTTTMTALLDIPNKKVTYLYTEVRSGVDPMYGTSYLRCAPEDQQITHPSICKEVAND